MTAPVTDLLPLVRRLPRILNAEGGGVRVIAFMSGIPRHHGHRLVVVRVAEGGDAPAWRRWLPYRSAQERRDAIRAMRREALKMWWAMMTKEEDGDGQQEA